MHRTDIKDSGGNDWHVFHNGDWSGDVYIRPADCPRDAAPNIIVPGFILKNACRAAVLEELKGKLETFLDGLV
jgi:hypothetical protein